MNYFVKEDTKSLKNSGNIIDLRPGQAVSDYDEHEDDQSRRQKKKRKKKQAEQEDSSDTSNRSTQRAVRRGGGDVRHSIYSAFSGTDYHF